MDKKEELVQCIYNEDFDGAKAVAFQLIQIDDDLDAVKWALEKASDRKDTVTYKIVDKMLRYL